MNNVFSKPYKEILNLDLLVILSGSKSRSITLSLKDSSLCLINVVTKAERALKREAA